MGKRKTEIPKKAVYDSSNTLLAAMAQPNILLLMPDQWRWDWDGAAHRAAPLRTPTLDRLRVRNQL